MFNAAKTKGAQHGLQRMRFSANRLEKSSDHFTEVM